MRRGDEISTTNYHGTIDRSRTIPALIAELLSFNDPELEVRISIDGGKNSHPISLVGNFGRGRFCLLEFALHAWLERPQPWKDRSGFMDRGKKIPQLVRELRIWEDEPERIVIISDNDGDDCYPITCVEKRDGCCLLMYCPDDEAGG